MGRQNLVEQILLVHVMSVIFKKKQRCILFMLSFVDQKTCVECEKKQYIYCIIIYLQLNVCSRSRIAHSYSIICTQQNNHGYIIVPTSKNKSSTKKFL